MSELARIAGWEPGPLRAAAGSLTAVVEGFPSWRHRLESVGRELAAAGSWSGPAAAEAADAVLTLATAAHAVGSALTGSLDHLDRLAGQAAAAHGLAQQALALAAAEGIALGPDGHPIHLSPRAGPGMAADQVAELAQQAAVAQRAGALAEEALRAAAAAAAEATGAEDALRGVGVVDAFTPATFADLAALLHIGGQVAVPTLPVLPGDRSPGAVAAWWTGLSAAAQLGVLAADPETLGRLDGVPAWARDRANRLLLARLLETPDAPGHDTAVVVAGTLAAQATAGRDTQLYEFVPRLGLAAVAVGDLDTARALAVLVPGVLTTVADDLSALVNDARRVTAAARDAEPGRTVAALAWLGYRTPPRLPEMATRTDARVGGRRLDDALDGLAAARDAGGGDPPRTTVLAHSYGTVVLDEAAARPGRLAADAVVLLGSPGMGNGGAAALEAREVYHADDRGDPVSTFRWFGHGPWEPGYGAAPLPTDGDEGHTRYYDPDHPTLAALGRVVTGADGRR